MLLPLRRLARRPLYASVSIITVALSLAAAGIVAAAAQVLRLNDAGDTTQVDSSACGRWRRGRTSPSQCRCLACV
jgi:hypothetical protein